MARVASRRSGTVKWVGSREDKQGGSERVKTRRRNVLEEARPRGNRKGGFNVNSGTRIRVRFALFECLF